MKTDRKRAKRGHTIANFQSLEPGQSFYSEMLPKGLQAYASIYGKKIQTEICLVMTDYRSITPKVQRLTKVTIL
jgi:hypothetical protein